MVNDDMKPIHVILKATEGCNMRCKYCYNCDSMYSENILPEEKLDKLLRILADTYDTIHLVWHGGEPLLCGIEYFKHAIEIERAVFNNKGVIIQNSIQTNATLINDDWIAFFKKHRFKLGISFDGIDNSIYRQQTEKVLQVFELLRKKRLAYGCLAVVADDSYDMLENYKFFCSHGIHFAISPMFAEGGGENLPPLSVESYIWKVNALFDHWIYDTQGVDVRLFSDYISMILGSRTRTCTHGSCHGKWICITPDGNLYNCGRDSMRKYCFGNIDDISSISEAFSSDGFRQLLLGAIERRQRCKDTCDLFSYCESGCSDCALLENGLASTPGFSCKSFQSIFSHVNAQWREILESRTPLSKLNPAIRRIALKRLSERI